MLLDSPFICTPCHVHFRVHCCCLAGNRRLYEVSIWKWVSTGGAQLCECSLPLCLFSLVVGNATAVMADMATCNLHPPPPPAPPAPAHHHPRLLTPWRPVLPLNALRVLHGVPPVCSCML
jgi:hypothetical protein